MEFSVSYHSLYSLSCYLRSRDDTVHCIVTSLTEEGATDLSDELSGCKKITLCDVVTSVEDDMENWEAWVPDPVEVVPGYHLYISRLTFVPNYLF